MLPSDDVNSATEVLADTALDATQEAPSDQGGQSASDGFSPRQGMQLKHYEIIRKLGEGGMGAVYLARDTRLGRRVAVKFLHEQSGPALDRFLIEARATALCQHENIVVIYDVGEFESYPYMVLEYIEGRTLRAVMEEQRKGEGIDGLAAVQSILEWMIPVARALGAAHKMGIVHRDLKPENILVANSGLVKVVDFGIAKQFNAPKGTTNPETPLETLGNVNLTGHGASPGTMMYMSPEQWLSDEIDGRTDIWAFGLMLFEMLVGAHPLAPVTLNALTQVIRFDMKMPSAKEKRPDAAALGEIIDHCLQKRKDERLATVDELRQALEDLRSRLQAPAFSEEECPFAGLSAFQETDARRYFGREQDIAAVLGKLRHQEIVAIVGPSGTGKSSFVRAGLIPALKASGLAWETYVIRPGRKPLAALADILMQLADGSSADVASDVAAFEENLRKEPGMLGVQLRARCRKKGAAQRILLFVDQFEELYTLGIAPDEREIFHASLLGVADDASSPLRVILSIRADFLDRLAEDRPFLSAVTRGLHFLPPMAVGGLREALVKPLESIRYQFADEALIEEIMSSLDGMKCPLPILQFVATQLWEARDKDHRRLTTEAYRALGGVAGALSSHADSVLAAMSPDEQKTTRSVFLRLVTPERTRAIVLFEELCELFANRNTIEHVVQRLAEARLIVIESGSALDGKTVELVHESLIERWGRLRLWLDENQQDAQFLTEVRNAAAQWEKNDRSVGFLWRDEAARKAEAWFSLRTATGHVELGAREVEYLRAVVAFAQRLRRRQWQVVLAMLALAVVVVIVVGALAVGARNEAKRADEQAGRAIEEARQARNATRLAAARQIQLKDPTKALSLLREIEKGTHVPGWTDLILQAKNAGVAEVVKLHPELVIAAAYSPDGKRIASSLYNRTIEIWSVDGSAPPVLLRGFEEPAFSIAWSHDGKRIASGARNKTVRIWNSDGTGSPIVLTGHEGSVRSIDWSLDDRRIIVSPTHGKARIWKTDGSTEHVFIDSGAKSEAMIAAWNATGDHIALGMNDGSLQIWDGKGEKQEIVLQGHTDRILGFDWHPDGKHIVTASRDKTVRIWNIANPEEQVVFQGHTDGVEQATWSPDGRLIASASQDKTVRLWNPRGDVAPVVIRGHENKVTSVGWSPDGQSIMSSSLDREVRLWSVAALLRNVYFIGHKAPVYGVSFSPDGQKVVSASEDKTVRIWSLDGATESRILQGHDGPVYSVYFSPDGKKVVSASRDKTIRVWPIDGTSEPVILQGHENAVSDAVFTPDGQYVVSAADDKTVRIWDLRGQSSPTILTGHENKVASVAVSPDGKRIASASFDHTLRIWSRDGDQKSLVLRGHSASSCCVSWSPDGQHLISSSDDHTLRLWSAHQGGESLVFEGHLAESSVHSLAAFHPQGKKIVSAARDGSIRIWNTTGSRDSVVLYAGDFVVSSAAWSPEGTRIVAAIEDNSVGLWRDVEVFEKTDDTRLWRATAYCLPMDVRRRLLGFSEAQSLADFESCQRRVTEAMKTP